MYRDHLDNIALVSSAYGNKELSRSEISPEARKRRRDKYRLREALQKITTKPRVECCGTRRIKGASAILKIKQDGTAFLSGVQRCGHAQFCPVCGAKIANARAREITKAVDIALERGNGIYLATFTMPHLQRHTLKELRVVVSEAFGAVTSGRAWVDDVAEFGVLGQIRTLEATHGLNGWHPHQHVLIFTDTPLERPDILHARLFGRWSRYIRRKGYGEALPEYTQLDHIHAQRGIGRYLSKIGVNIGNELTRSDLKKGRRENWTTWEILWATVTTGEKEYSDLWFEWEETMGGIQLCRWSNGLKKLFDVDELTDQEIAQQEEDFIHMRILTDDEWNHLRKNPDDLCALLSTVNTHGLQGAEDFFEWLAQKINAPPAYA